MPESLEYMLIRGGSSKGLYFHGQQFPSDEQQRNRMLVDIMGRGERQIDGLGGGHPLTSKAALIWPSQDPDTDVDFLFAQVVVGEDRVDTKPNCGNILAGVGPFALESGMVDISDNETSIRVNMLNSCKTCHLLVQTPNKQIVYEGDTAIAGVPGTAAPIVCNYQNTAGSACGSLLPTGDLINQVDDVEVTCIDNGMPVVIMRAADLGISGYESPQILNDNQELKSRLESIRLQLGPSMNLGDVSASAVPKMCLISQPVAGGILNTRTFIPHQCHQAIGVLGAVSVATACITDGTVAANFLGKAKPVNSGDVSISVEHPTGEFTCVLDVAVCDNEVQVNGAGVLRTARLLSRGELFLPHMRG